MTTVSTTQRDGTARTASDSSTSPRTETSETQKSANVITTFSHLVSRGVDSTIIAARGSRGLDRSGIDSTIIAATGSRGVDSMSPQN